VNTGLDVGEGVAVAGGVAMGDGVANGVGVATGAGVAGGVALGAGFGFVDGLGTAGTPITFGEEPPLPPPHAVTKTVAVVSKNVVTAVVCPIGTTLPRTFCDSHR
jgi:hypothetical protein